MGTVFTGNYERKVSSNRVYIPQSIIVGTTFSEVFGSNAHYIIFPTRNSHGFPRLSVHITNTDTFNERFLPEVTSYYEALRQRDSYQKNPDPRFKRFEDYLIAMIESYGNVSRISDITWLPKMNNRRFCLGKLVDHILLDKSRDILVVGRHGYIEIYEKGDGHESFKRSNQSVKERRNSFV